MGDLEMIESIALTGLGELGALNVPARSSAVEITYLRDLTAEDLLNIDLAREANENKQPRSTLSKLRDRHHNLARLIAEGGNDVQLAALTGYAPAYICNLRQDPLFSELVVYYKTGVEAQYLGVHDRRAALGTAAIELLQDRLDDPAEAAKIQTKTLIELAEFGSGDKVKGQILSAQAAAQVAAGRGPAVAVSISFPSDPRDGRSTVKEPVLIEATVNKDGSTK